MTAAELIRAALPISLASMVLALGTRCALSDCTYLFRKPGLLVRSVLAMNVALPIIALAIAVHLPLHPDVKIALIALAVSPVPPILPPRQLQLVTHESYVYGLLVATAALSIVLVPITVALLGNVLGREFAIEPLLIARTVLVSVLVPLALGMGIQRLWPRFASRLAPLLSTLGSVVLLVALVAILAIGWRAFGALLGDGTLLVFAAFTLLSLAIGHVFGGPDPDDQTVLALACASRHPGVAIAIGAALFPSQKLVGAAVVLALLVGLLASAPYTAWRKRVHERAVHVQAAGSTHRR
jgi:BASS family bile acid:Na+ symporter